MLDEPLSFWGGLDPETATDRRAPPAGGHDAHRPRAVHAVRPRLELELVAFAESIRTGTAPAAVVLGAEPDAIVALGAIVAAELYGIEILVIVADLSTITAGAPVRIGADDAGRRLAMKRPD